MCVVCGHKNKIKINSAGNTFGLPQAKCDSIFDFGFSDLVCDLNLKLELQLELELELELVLDWDVERTDRHCDYPTNLHTVKPNIKSKVQDQRNELGARPSSIIFPIWRGVRVRWLVAGGLGALVRASNKVSCSQDHTYPVLTTNESISPSVPQPLPLPLLRKRFT